MEQTETTFRIAGNLYYGRRNRNHFISNHDSPRANFLRMGGFVETAVRKLSKKKKNPTSRSLFQIEDVKYLLTVTPHTITPAAC